MVEVLKREQWLSERCVEQQRFRAPVTYLMGWLSEVLTRSLVVNTSLLLGSISSIAAEISCVRFPLCGIAHSWGHSAEGVIGEVGFVESHHARMSARVSWWALMDLTWSGTCTDIGT